MRLMLGLFAAVSLSVPAFARDYAPNYALIHGALSEGYKEKLQDDGSYRIVTEYHTRDPMVALDVALYRAAELAREAGKPYVQVLSGDGRSSYGVSNGFVFARPTDSAAAPSDCRAKRCYTAEVAKVLDALSGPTGDQPGVAKPSSFDERGRTVTIMGYGIGAIAWANR